MSLSTTYGAKGVTQLANRALLGGLQGEGVAARATGFSIIGCPGQNSILWAMFPWLRSEAAMRVGYFGYHIKQHRTGDEHIVDLRNFVRDFVACKDIKFKQQFIFNGENLLLLPSGAGSTYLFVQTRDLEIIKRVKRGQWDADDIRRVLERDQSVGFASYVSLNAEWLGTACRVMSPRHTAFAHLMNSLFDALQIPFHFILRSFSTQLPESRVAQLDRVGRISIEVNHSSPLLGQVWSALTGGDGTELQDIAGMRIQVIPFRKRSADMKENLQEIINGLPRDGLESLEARAKAEALDHMSDMYIFGNGALRSFIDVEEESQIPYAMATAARGNSELQHAIQEFKDEPHFDTTQTAANLGISWSSTYGGHVGRSHD